MVCMAGRARSGALGFGVWAIAAAIGVAGNARADDAPSADAPAAPETWAVHGQLTNIWQYHPEFRSPYQGANSLDHLEHVNETTDADLYAGLSLWKGMEVWVDPEINQGIAPSDTLGVAGYVNGDGAKVGKISSLFPGSAGLRPPDLRPRRRRRQHRSRSVRAGSDGDGESGRGHAGQAQRHGHF